MNGRSRPTRTVVVIIAAGLGWNGALTAQDTVDFQSWTDAQKEEFLRSAEATRFEELNVGITRSERVTLDHNGLIHSAHFQTIDEYKPLFQGVHGSELNFRDSYKFNIAAYRLDRLIGLNLVPVSVERRIGRRDGAATWWIDALMTERERRRERATPPIAADWNDQMYNIRVFNELIYNVDPNLGNVVITEDWLPRPIDFTRSFRSHSSLRNPDNLVRIDRRVYEGLKRLTKEILLAELGDYLQESALIALLDRRDTIVATFDQQILEQGLAAVICDRPGH